VHVGRSRYDTCGGGSCEWRDRVGYWIWAANCTTEHCGFGFVHSWAVPGVVCVECVLSAGCVVVGVVRG